MGLKELKGFKEGQNLYTFSLIKLHWACFNCSRKTTHFLTFHYLFSVIRHFCWVFFCLDVILTFPFLIITLLKNRRIIQCDLDWLLNLSFQELLCWLRRNEEDIKHPWGGGIGTTPFKIHPKLAWLWNSSKLLEIEYGIECVKIRKFPLFYGMTHCWCL